MARTICSISLPEMLRDFAEQRVRTGGYSSVSEYVRELIRTDQRRLASGDEPEFPDLPERFRAARPSFGYQQQARWDRETR